MPNLNDCIEAAVREGAMSREAADEAKVKFDDFVSEFTADGKLGWHEAQVRAADRLQRDIERDTARRKRMRLFQAQTQDRIRQRLDAAPAGKRDKAALAVLGFDPSGRNIGENVEARHGALRGWAFAQMTPFIDKYRSKLGGFTRETADMDLVVRGLFGENTPPASKALADGVMAARKYLVGRNRAAGGDIVDREKWGWVQHHDRAAIARTAKDDWVSFTLDRLDPEKMRDGSGQPMTARQLRSTVEGSYDSILTGGLQDMAGTFDKTFTSPINSRIAHRELVFRDSKSWLEYQRRFGSPDMFGAIVGEIDRLARDTALVEVMGPYSRASLKFLENQIDVDRGAVAAKLEGKAAAKTAERVGKHRNLEAVYDQVSGAANIPADAGWARVSQSNRNLVTAARLGGAIFSSLSDMSTATLTARMNGIPTVKLLGEVVKQFSSFASRREAARAGFIAETWVGDVASAQRIMGEVTGSLSTRRIADTALRITGLNAWTDGVRNAFKLSLIGHLTENAGKGFDRLDGATRRALGRYGIDAADWDLYRSTPLWTDAETKADFIRPEDVWLEFQGTALPLGEKDARFKSAQKFNDLVLGETAFALVTPSARARALITGGTQPGTLIGEAVRNVTLFRSFSIAFLYQHLSRAMAERGIWSKGRYLAWSFAGMTLGGAVAEQASSLYRGRDPRPMDDPAFWASAVARGGSLGPVGDFIFSDVSRHGNNLAESMLGPVLGGEVLAGTAATIDNLKELVVKGEAKNLSPEIRRFVQGLVPGGSTWYARLAFERLLFDELESFGDPDAPSRFARAEAKARQEFKTEAWWPRGQTLPERAPDLGNIGGTP